MSDASAKREWVTRVLGCVFADESANAMPGRQDIGVAPTIDDTELLFDDPFDEPDDTEQVAVEDEESADPQLIYDAARERVSAGLAVLQKLIEKHNDPVSIAIAEFGLLGLTDGEHVKLTKALLAYRSSVGDGRPAAAKQVGEAVGSYRKHLGTDIFPLLDNNPFGVDIGWVDTLDAALGKIASTVQA